MSLATGEKDNAKSLLGPLTVHTFAFSNGKGGVSRGESDDKLSYVSATIPVVLDEYSTLEPGLVRSAKLEATPRDDEVSPSPAEYQPSPYDIRGTSDGELFRPIVFSEQMLPNFWGPEKWRQAHASPLRGSRITNPDLREFVIDPQIHKCSNPKCRSEFYMLPGDEWTETTTCGRPSCSPQECEDAVKRKIKTLTEQVSPREGAGVSLRENVDECLSKDRVEFSRELERLRSLEKDTDTEVDFYTRPVAEKYLAKQGDPIKDRVTPTTKV